MTQKNYNTITGCLFVIIAILHLWRALSGTVVWVGSVSVPVWISWVGVILALVLGSYGLKHGKSSKR